MKQSVKQSVKHLMRMQCCQVKILYSVISKNFRMLLYENHYQLDWYSVHQNLEKLIANENHYQLEYISTYVLIYYQV